MRGRLFSRPDFISTCSLSRFRRVAVVYAGVSFGGVISAGSRSGLGRRNRKVWRKDRPDQAVKSETSNAKAAGTDIRRRYGPNASSARSSGGAGPSRASTGRLPSR